MRALHDLHALHFLLPAPSLEKSCEQLAVYWSRFRSLYPDNSIFQTLTEEQLQFCLPLKLHGDEGRSILEACAMLVRQYVYDQMRYLCPGTFAPARQKETTSHAVQLAMRLGQGHQQIREAANGSTRASSASQPVPKLDY